MERQIKMKSKWISNKKLYVDMNEQYSTFRPDTSMSKQSGKYIGFGISKDG